MSTGRRTDAPAWRKKENMTNPAVGQRVSMAASFLRQVGGTKEIADMRGIIKEIKGKFAGSTLVKVLWDGETETRGCLSCNLSLAVKGSPVQDIN